MITKVRIEASAKTRDEVTAELDAVRDACLAVLPDKVVGIWEPYMDDEGWYEEQQSVVTLERRFDENNGPHDVFVGRSVIGVGTP